MVAGQCNLTAAGAAGGILGRMAGKRGILRCAGRWIAGVMLGIALLSGVLAIVSEWCGAEVTYSGATVAGVGFGEGYYTFFAWRSDDPTFLVQVAPVGWRAKAGGPLTPIAYRLPGGGTRESVRIGGFLAAKHQFAGSGANHTTVYVQLPCWMVALVGVPVLPWGVMQVYRRWRHHEPWRCWKCGYDLRATPERCPECGSTAGAAKAV